ncbi:unnamed protein product [Zymoseptoria tritici ST99CH_1A5]|uniref:Uncharacterized protein n=1 Tax=Zymoseptoria tritici ST99CH_1A5 TaxID=1276529 RepID=A0A1Y6LUH8_ZYMTR|nr:unnamed protein product [Zymoseptoria tritici ST99CH_1A5]
MESQRRLARDQPSSSVGTLAGDTDGDSVMQDDDDEEISAANGRHEYSHSEADWMEEDWVDRDPDSNPTGSGYNEEGDDTGSIAPFTRRQRSATAVSADLTETYERYNAPQSSTEELRVEEP